MWSHYSDESTGFVLEYNRDVLESKISEYYNNVISSGSIDLVLGDMISSANSTHEIKFLETYRDIQIQKKSDGREIYGIYDVKYQEGIYNFSKIFLKTLMKLLSYWNDLEGMDDMFEKFIKTFIEANEISKSVKISELINIVTTKTLYWKYEDEVRIIIPMIEKKHIDEKYPIIENVRPTSIYLGVNISAAMEKRIKEIAEIKDIPVYKTNLEYVV